VNNTEGKELLIILEPMHFTDMPPLTELERELKIIILKAIYIQIENDHDPEVNEERLGLIDLGEISPL